MNHRLCLLPLCAALFACGGRGLDATPATNAPDAADDAGADFLQTSFLLPKDGTPNNDGPIGPFCCTGTTAIVRDRAGAPVGYAYFFGWKGDAYNTGADTSAASDVDILLSGVADLSAPDAAQVTGDVDFLAADMKPGAALVTKVGALLYTVTIVDVTPVMLNDQTFFDMGSLVIRVDVSAA